MSRAETFIPVFRHPQFDGPGTYNPSYSNFVASLSKESTTYPLTEDGKDQILKAIRETPSPDQIDLILVSQFLRTQQSAQVIFDEIKNNTGREVKIVASPLLNTVWMPPNSLSEEKFRELRQTGRKSAVANEMFQRWASGQIGESPKMVRARIRKLLAYLKENIDRGLSAQPIVITHSSFASAMARHFQGLDLTSPRNEEQILKVAGHYLLAVDGNPKKKYFSVELLKGKFLS